MRTSWLWILLVVAALFAGGCKGEEGEKKGDEKKGDEKKGDEKKGDEKKEGGKSAGGTPEEQFYALTDELVAAFKEEDCTKSAEMLGKVDTAKMSTLSGELKEKYPDGPTEEAKKKMGEMMPAMQAAMKNCASDEGWMKAMEAVGKAMRP